MPSNNDIGRTKPSAKKSSSQEEIYISDDSSDSGESVQSDGPGFRKTNKDLKLSPFKGVEASAMETSKVRVTRDTVKAAWSIGLVAKKGSDGGYFLSVDREGHGLENGQIIKSISGLEVGTASLNTFKAVLSFLEKHVDITLEVLAKKTSEEDKPDAVGSG